MKQKLQDLLLIVKTDRRVWAAGGFLGVIVLLLFMIGDWDAPQQQYRPVVAGALPQGPSSQRQVDEPYRDLVRAFQNRMEDLAKSSNQQSVELGRIRKDFEENRDRVKGLFESIVDRIENMSGEIDRLNEASKVRQDTGPTTPTQEVVQPDELQPLGFDEATVPPPPAPPAPPTRISVISPGDSVPVFLLTGVNAPVDGTPYPTLFKLNGIISGPDGSSLDLGEARIIAAAQGSETDARAIFRLTNLAMRHPDGRRAVIPIDGWVIGEDGIRGLEGRLIDKLGRLILATAGVSFTATLGQAMANRNNNLNIQGPPGLQIYGSEFDAALGNAMVDASSRLVEVLIRRYEKLVPVVEVLSGRSAVAIFSSQAEVTVLDENGADVSLASLD